MAKEKRTEQLSWWDKYVLGKQTFYYASPLSIDECAKRIAYIHDTNKHREARVSFTEDLAGNMRFEIVSTTKSAKNKHKGLLDILFSINTHIVGDIYQTNTHTIVRGTSVVGSRLEDAQAIIVRGLKYFGSTRNSVKKVSQMLKL